jgi:hypothetical protein
MDLVHPFPWGTDEDHPVSAHEWIKNGLES